MSTGNSKNQTPGAAGADEAVAAAKKAADGDSLDEMRDALREVLAAYDALASRVEALESAPAPAAAGEGAVPKAVLEQIIHLSNLAAMIRSTEPGFEPYQGYVREGLMKVNAIYMEMG